MYFGSILRSMLHCHPGSVYEKTDAGVARSDGTACRQQIEQYIMSEDDQRPDPDALLDEVKAEQQEATRSKLKIFFGASPGVGKTYAMLLEAQRLRSQGIDVVAGMVETHGRMETAALLVGLERLAPRLIEYHGRALPEFDLDAALKRKPAVLLLDELAHSNVPGCRHPKRWQDVRELLDGGISVLTTVNVQHMESLNDIVGDITGVRVRETVPDHVFADADEVVLVDLPPDDLLQRLREGKVYIPEQAERAIANFFRKGNLIALRELALRQTASRVDEQVRAFRRRDSTRAVWSTGDTLLACVGPDPSDERVVRAAARLAARLDAEWHAVYVETPTLQRLPGPRRGEILKTLKLAQGLGAVTATLTGQDALEPVLDYARRNNLGRIVMGRSARTRKRWWGRRPLSWRLGEQAPDLDILVVAREELRESERPRIETASDAGASMFVNVRGYVYAVLACLGITALSMPLAPRLDMANIVMLFLLGVLLIAYRFGRGPAVLAAVLNVASYDVFFVPPRLTFAVSDVQYLVTFAVMLTVGLLTGHLTAGLRYQARVASYREERARSLSELAKALSSALVEAQVVEISDKFVESTFRAKAAILLPDAEGKLQVPVAHGETPTYDLAIAQWCYDKNEPAGAGTDTLPANAQLYLPLKAPLRVRGVLVIEPNRPRLLMIPEQRRLLDTFAALAAIALERIHFVTVAQETLLKIESERLRSSLLAALSHDLRTPLTALVGMAETLSLELVGAQSAHAEKADVIRDQALRTSHMVNNLLEMAKLQAGEVKPRKDWQSLEEIVGSALKDLEPALARHPVQVDLPTDLPLIECDGALVERVLVNLLENATKYTPSGTAIGVTARRAETELHVEVWDEGPGLPAGQERAIFAQFTRGKKESTVPGVGLGLAICEAIVHLHGGKIWAENRTARGARFVFTLPLSEQPIVEAEMPR